LAYLYILVGVLSTVSHVVTREGLQGLFRGNSAQMVRIFPYAATQFASYEQYKVVGIIPGYTSGQPLSYKCVLWKIQPP